MTLTSGGLNWRRKRNKAERLHPVAEDASSTTQLFDARLRHRSRPQAVPASSLPTGTAAYQPLPDEPVPGEPLLRYEWRTAAGDVLVVEAAWPARPTPNEPPVDLRPPGRVDVDPVTVARFESPGA